MVTELQARLMGLSAPDGLVGLAHNFADLESCWNACTTPEFLLWLAARLSTTGQERHEVVACLAELTRRAGRSCRRSDQAVQRAASTAEAWASGGAGLDEFAAAERAALDAAGWAAVAAAEEGARARRYLRSSSPSRPASFGNGRRAGALAAWREANQARRAALAAAGTVRAAALAAEAEAVRCFAGTAPGALAENPAVADWGSWAALVSRTAGYAMSALDRHRGSGRASRAARRTAGLIRRRLPCPRLADPEVS